MSETAILRKQLLTASMESRTLDRIDVREIRFAPGQQTGRHRHPCPVVGYIAEGTALIEIEGRPAQRLSSGSAFYEPANTIVARFDNASSSSPMTFVAYYLLEGDQPLIDMLPG